MIPGKVSVVLAVYNGEAFIQKAIESVLKQSYTNWELIIINDGSTDQTPHIIAQYKDERIRIITNEQNLKLIASLNKGLHLADGEFIARLDADDICYEDRFAIQVDHLSKNPNVGLVATGYRMFDHAGRERIKSEEIDARAMRQRLAFINPIRHSSVMFRSSLLNEKTKGYSHDFKHAEDYELWIRLAKFSDVVVIPDVLVSCLVHNDSISEQFSKGMRQSFNRAKMLHCDFLYPGLSEFESKTITRIPFQLERMKISELSLLDQAMTKLVKGGVVPKKDGAFISYAIRMRDGGWNRFFHNFNGFYFKPSTLDRIKGDIASIFDRRSSEVLVADAWFNN